MNMKRFAFIQMQLFNALGLGMLLVVAEMNMVDSDEPEVVRGQTRILQMFDFIPPHEILTIAVTGMGLWVWIQWKFTKRIDDDPEDR